MNKWMWKRHKENLLLGVMIMIVVGIVYVIAKAFGY